MKTTQERRTTKQVDMSLDGQYDRLERLKVARRDGDEVTASKLAQEQKLGEMGGDWAMRY